jgi:hypothetical protein
MIEFQPGTATKNFINYKTLQLTRFKSMLLSRYFVLILARDLYSSAILMSNCNMCTYYFLNMLKHD